MKKISHLFTLIMVAMQLSACATVAGNYPVKDLPAAQPTVTGLRPEFTNMLVLMTVTYNGTDQLDFFKYKEGWLDPQKVIDQEAERMQVDSGGMPMDNVLSGMRQMTKYKWLFVLAADDDVVLYRIGVDVIDDLIVNFTKPGALNFECASGITITDLGVIVPIDFSPILSWSDSRRSVATLSKHSNNGRPAGWPNIILVVMPKASYGQTVVKVTPTENMSFSGHAALAMK